MPPTSANAWVGLLLMAAHYSQLVDGVILHCDVCGLAAEFMFPCFFEVHGFPKVMGVLTHLDRIPDIKKLRKAKKRLKVIIPWNAGLMIIWL